MTDTEVQQKSNICLQVDQVDNENMSPCVMCRGKTQTIIYENDFGKSFTERCFDPECKYEDPNLEPYI